MMNCKRMLRLVLYGFIVAPLASLAAPQGKSVHTSGSFFDHRVDGMNADESIDIELVNFNHEATAPQERSLGIVKRRPRPYGATCHSPVSSKNFWQRECPRRCTCTKPGFSGMSCLDNVIGLSAAYACAAMAECTCGQAPDPNEGETCTRGGRNSGC